RAQRGWRADQRRMPCPGGGEAGADRRGAAIRTAGHGQPKEAAATIEEMLRIELWPELRHDCRGIGGRQREAPDDTSGIGEKLCRIADLAPEACRVLAMQLLGHAERRQ